MGVRHVSLPLQGVQIPQLTSQSTAAMDRYRSQHNRDDPHGDRRVGREELTQSAPSAKVECQPSKVEHLAKVVDQLGARNDQAPHEGSSSGLVRRTKASSNDRHSCSAQIARGGPSATMRPLDMTTTVSHSFVAQHMA